MEDELRKVKRQKTAGGRQKASSAQRNASVQRGKKPKTTVDRQLPSDLQNFDVKAAADKMTPPPLYPKNLKQRVKYTGDDQHIMTRAQLFDMLWNEPTLSEFEYTKEYFNETLSKYTLARNLHALMHTTYPDATIALGPVQYNMQGERMEWYYVGVRSAEHLQPASDSA